MLYTGHGALGVSMHFIAPTISFLIRIFVHESAKPVHDSVHYGPTNF